MYGATAIQTTHPQLSHALRRSAAEGQRVGAVERVRPAKEELARAQRDAEEQLLAQRRRDKRNPDGPNGFSRPLSPSGFHAQLLAQLTESDDGAVAARQAEALAAYPADDETTPDMEILEPIVFDGDDVAGGAFAPGEVRISLDILV